MSVPLAKKKKEAERYKANAVTSGSSKDSMHFRKSNCEKHISSIRDSDLTHHSDFINHVYAIKL